MTIICTGTMKLFFPPRDGYGIIAPDSGGPDHFFPAEHCHEARSIFLETGMRVSYEPYVGRKGWRAKDVRLTGFAGRCPCCGGAR